MCDVTLYVPVAKIENNLCTIADIVVFIPVLHTYDMLAEDLYWHTHSAPWSQDTVLKCWFSLISQ